MIATSAPFSQYFDKNGDPLDSGYVYFGVPDANPETSPIPAFWDEAGTQPVAQPARTLAGYIVRNGTPARVYVEGAYSQTVKNKKGELVYYAANSEDYSNLPVNVATIEATNGQTVVNLPFSYTRGNNSLAVYLNGTLLLKDRDYIETSETAIQMLNPLKIGPGGADEVTAIGGRLINPSSAVGTVSAAALAAGSGAGLVGYDPALTFPGGTVGERLRRTTYTVDAITSVNATALGLVDEDVVVARGQNTAGDGAGGVWEYDSNTDSFSLVDRKETWAEDYYDTANGASAWLIAFQSALAALGSRGGIIRFKERTVTFNDVFTVNVPGVSIFGAGTAGLGTAAQGTSNIIGDHNNGPVIHFTRWSSRVDGFAVGASAARKAGAINGGSASTPCCGILYEGADTATGRADNMDMGNVRVYDQPFHGVIWSGLGANFRIDSLTTDSNAGHGWVIDRGTMTGRANTDAPGIFIFNNPRSYDNGGHAWAVGNPNDTVLPSYRVFILQGETYRNGSQGVVVGTPDLTTNLKLYENYQAYMRGDVNEAKSSAFGGDLAGVPATGGIFLAGRLSKATDNRYIDCLAAAGAVKLGNVQPGSTPSYDLSATGIEVRTPDANMNPAVQLDAAIIGIDISSNSNTSITSLVNPAQLATCTKYLVRSHGGGIVTDQTIVVGAASIQSLGGATQNIQAHGGSGTGVGVCRWSNDITGGLLYVGKSRSATVGTPTIVQQGDTLGAINFVAADGDDMTSVGASIAALVDGTPGANDMPGRLSFRTTNDGAATASERMIIDSAGQIAKFQAAALALSTTRTLTPAEIKSGLYASNTGSAVDHTLPTGTDLDASYAIAIGTSMSFEWVAICTTSGSITILANTGHTIIGNPVIAANTSGMFRTRRSGANTYITYRIAG